MVSGDNRTRTPVRTVTKILGCSALHFIVSVFVSLFVFGLSMGMLDAGGTPSERLMYKILSVAFEVLWFPFLAATQALGGRGGRLVQLPLLLGNSVLWGLAIYFGVTRFRWAIGKAKSATAGLARRSGWQR